MERKKSSTMQPPPRKAKITTSLRNTQNDQLTKLQYKHQVDIDLLDDIRNFTKLRASIEKEYGQALLKLSANFLQRKFLSITSDKKDGSGNKVVYQVWKTLLDETEKIAKARLAAVEVYQQQISESAKIVRSAKLQVAKKCFDNMRKMHEEIQTCVTEIDKTKKLYFEEEHMAHGAREKASDADEKLKRKRGRIFQSIAALQKNSAKFSSRKEACDIQSTKARNDYILALVAANAHQKRFYDVDLPQIIQVLALDCGFCENVREYIVLMARTELLTCAACQNSYTKVQQEGESITAKYTLECFLNENPVLGSMIQYNFDPCDEDPLQSISLEHNAALCLSKEARKWAACIAKETRTLRDCTKELSKLLSQIAAGEKETTADGQTIDLETRMDELKNIIRRAETSKLKAEARIEVLRDAGVNVNEWLKPIEGETLALHEDLSRKGSTSSRSSNFSSHSEVAGEASSEANDSVYDSDFNDAASDFSAAARIPSVSDTDSVIETQPRDVVATVTEAWDSTAVNEAWAEVEAGEVTVEVQEKPPSVDNTEYGVTTGTRCVALFNYEALNSDELSFVEQEELEIIDEGEGDGWIKARNYKGEEGFIPQNYVELVDVPSGDPTSGRSGLVSFSSVDYTMPEEDEIQGLATDGAESQGSGPPTSLDLEVTTATSGMAQGQVPQVHGESMQYCRAIYDYEATCDEELTFMEGQVIEIMRKTVHDVDDGWWEGRINGVVGIFPSLVVEELKIDGEPQTPQDLASPPGSAPPPLYTPPKPMFLVPPAQVILTQPTPETEHVPTDGTKPQVALLLEENDFQLELSCNQQAHYQSQFSASDSESSEHEPPATGDPGTYDTLVSSPDSPAHSMLPGAEAGTSINENGTAPTTTNEVTEEADESQADDVIVSDDQPQQQPKPAKEEMEEKTSVTPESEVIVTIDAGSPEPPRSPSPSDEQNSPPVEDQSTTPAQSEPAAVTDASKGEPLDTKKGGSPTTAEEQEKSNYGLDESEDSVTEATVLEVMTKHTGPQDLSEEEATQVSDEILDELGEKESASDSDVQPIENQPTEDTKDVDPKSNTDDTFDVRRDSKTKPSTTTDTVTTAATETVSQSDFGSDFTADFESAFKNEPCTPTSQAQQSGTAVSGFGSDFTADFEAGFKDSFVDSSKTHGDGGSSGKDPKRGNEV